MPTYEYECKICRHTFDAFQNITDDPLKSCPECGKAVRRLINGGTGVIFKGGGFYVTDKNRAKSAVTKPAKTETAESAACNGCTKTETPACPKAANS